MFPPHTYSSASLIRLKSDLAWSSAVSVSCQMAEQHDNQAWLLGRVTGVLVLGGKHRWWWLPPSSPIPRIPPHLMLAEAWRGEGAFSKDPPAAHPHLAGVLLKETASPPFPRIYRLPPGHLGSCCCLRSTPMPNQLSKA